MRPFSPVFFFVLCFCGVARAGFCAEISKLLGDDCKVAETDCLRITCVIDLLHVETIDVDLDLHGICSANPSIKFTVAEKEFNIHYEKVVGEGSDVEFPIPGLTIGIPLLPVKAGVYGAATIAGKEDDLKLFLGIDACAEAVVTECGSKLSKDLPYWILHGTFNASDVCSAPKTPTHPPTPAPTPSAAQRQQVVCISKFTTHKLLYNLIFVFIYPPPSRPYAFPYSLPPVLLPSLSLLV